MRRARTDSRFCTNATDRRGVIALAIAANVAIRTDSHLQQLSRSHRVCQSDRTDSLHSKASGFNRRPECPQEFANDASTPTVPRFHDLPTLKHKRNLLTFTRNDADIIERVSIEHGHIGDRTSGNNPQLPSHVDDLRRHSRR